jgi:hypothetical protein
MSVVRDDAEFVSSMESIAISGFISKQSGFSESFVYDKIFDKVCCDDLVMLWMISTDLPLE